MMVAFSFVLLSTCRHVSTWLRETPVNRYVPLDSMIGFHQYAAWVGVFFTCVHTIGHGFNFYYLATQSASDLGCLFREHYFP
jgi:dual oxidase